MRLVFSVQFWQSYYQAPPEIQRAFDRRAVMLATNIRHPSLRAKKYDHANDIWQARVNSNWRFYFQIADDKYILHDIMAHPK